MTVTDRPAPLRLLSAFVLGLVSLTLEIAYTRVISFKLFYYYTYFVIGLALLGSVRATVTRCPTGCDAIDTVRILAPSSHPLGGVGLPGSSFRIPTEHHRIWAASRPGGPRSIAPWSRWRCPHRGVLRPRR